MRLHPLSSLLLLSALAGCAGDLSEAEAFLERGSLLPGVNGPGDGLDGGTVDGSADHCATFDVDRLFRDTCGSIVCHGGPGTESGLDLESPGVYERLAGAPSLSCEGRTLHVPGDVGASFFIEKVRGPVPMGCGDIMPQIGERVPEADIACLEAWLLAEEAAAESEAP